MKLYHIARPFLFSCDAEKMHHFAMSLLVRFTPVLRLLASRPDLRLRREVFGVTFPNPIGLAAGFDKNAVALRTWEALGFGFAEVGTITSRAQPGNPKPRIFRLRQERGILNRLGFNNDGADAVAARLRRTREQGHWPNIPIGINLGKSKVTPIEEATADYLLSFERLLHFGDYFVLNISSPNTPGLRSLQDHSALHELLGTLQRRNSEQKPLLVKIAPDLSWEAIDEILTLAEEHKLAGIVATNTTTDHRAVPNRLRGQGGVSGAPLRARATEIVRYIAERSTLPIIAVGGIDSADAAQEKFDAGASLIQLYTGFIYEGPGLVREIRRSLQD